MARIYPLRPGLPVCKHYMKTGYCKHGAQCYWDHPPKGSAAAASSHAPAARGGLGSSDAARAEAAAAASSARLVQRVPAGTEVAAQSGLLPLPSASSDLPRKAAQACPYYMRTGKCSYKSTCKFDHPPRQVSSTGAHATFQAAGRGALESSGGAQAARSSGQASSASSQARTTPPSTRPSTYCPTRKLEEWTKEQVGQFVSSLTAEADFGDKASQYAETMVRQDVSGVVLMGLTETELKEELGMSLGHRKILKEHIALLSASV